MSTTGSEGQDQDSENFVRSLEYGENLEDSSEGISSEVEYHLKEEKFLTYSSYSKFSSDSFKEIANSEYTNMNDALSPVYCSSVIPKNQLKTHPYLSWEMCQDQNKV